MARLIVDSYEYWFSCGLSFWYHLRLQLQCKVMFSLLEYIKVNFFPSNSGCTSMTNILMILISELDLIVEQPWGWKIFGPRRFRGPKKETNLCLVFQGPFTFTVSPLIMHFFESGRSTISFPWQWLPINFQNNAIYHFIVWIKTWDSLILVNPKTVTGPLNSYQGSINSNTKV